MEMDDVISLSSDSSGPSSPPIRNMGRSGLDSENPVNSLNLEKSHRFEFDLKYNSCNTSTVKNPQFSRIVHSLSDSNESDSELLKDSDHMQAIRLHTKYGKERTMVATSHLGFSPNNKPCNSLEMVDIPVSLVSKNNLKTQNSRNIRKEERLKEKLQKDKEKEDSKLKKQKQKEEKKAEKLALQQSQKLMKPGHCTKLGTIKFEFVSDTKCMDANWEDDERDGPNEKETPTKGLMLDYKILGKAKLGFPIHHEKLMTVVLDASLITCSFGGMLLAAIQNSESKCEVLKKVVPNTISWTRDIPGSNKKEEDDLILIWQWQTVIPTIKNHTLCSKIQEIQWLNPNKIVFLIIYGLNGYFSYLKSKRKNVSEEEHPKKSRKRKSNDIDDYPYLTRKAIEEELIELQIMTNCNHRIIESSEDLAQVIVQITKAIAETPFKLDKQRRELENLEWFAVGDSRDCVSVDKEGHGLLRLWQQQLCQFNLAGHDTAQAIAAVYPSPSALVEAYKQCVSQKEGEGLLKDIQVRRCQGPLSSSRRVGPELSKKIYTFFCSNEGDTPLSQEQ